MLLDYKCEDDYPDQGNGYVLWINNYTANGCLLELDVPPCEMFSWSGGRRPRHWVWSSETNRAPLSSFGQLLWRSSFVCCHVVVRCIEPSIFCFCYVYFFYKWNVDDNSCAQMHCGYSWYSLVEWELVVEIEGFWYSKYCMKLQTVSTTWFLASWENCA